MDLSQSSTMASSIEDKFEDFEHNYGTLQLPEIREESKAGTEQKNMENAADVSETETSASCEQATTGVATVTEIKPLERVYYTLPKKTRPLMRMFSRKKSKTMAEVGVQVDEEEHSQEKQLTTFMHSVSDQISHMQQLCAKQDRLEDLGQKITDLLNLNKNINNSVESSSKNSDSLMVAYMQTKDELVHLKSKLEGSFTEKDSLLRRLDEQENELKLMIHERDEFRDELETSVSKISELELSTSFARENEDAVNSMSDKLKDALKKRDKYKKLFVKLKVNSSLVLDQYIQQLNAALGHNRQILEKAVQGSGPKNVLDQMKFIDNIHNIQEERNRLVDQVDLLDTQLVANDILVDELREHMDNMALLLEEYKKSGPEEPPTILAQQLQAQIDKYLEAMKNKEQYFADKQASLKEQMVKSCAAKLLDAPIVVKRMLSDETESQESQEQPSDETQEEKSGLRAVHSHGDTPDTPDTDSSSREYGEMRKSSAVDDLVVHENKVEATQSTPEFSHRGSFGDAGIASSVLDRHFYNFY